MDKWKRITLTDDQKQTIYKEWGVFYTQKKKLEIATNYYDISLNIQKEANALYNRSRCNRNIAQTTESLRDAKAAVECDQLNQAFNLEVCDALYQLNSLEEAKCTVLNNSLKFQGLKLNEFQKRNEVLDENFNATLGDTLGPHILENERYFYKALEKKLQETSVDTRPLWKILHKLGQCDAMSVLEKEEESISPREVARRKLAFKVFNQMYMPRSWIDVLFMKVLKSHPSLILSQSKWSGPQLEGITKNKYDVAMKFLKMLHVRTPLYTLKIRKSPNKNLTDKINEERLFRIQSQVHRNMWSILRNIKYLRKLKKIEELSRYIEEVLGDYVMLKTFRIMTWKLEFIYEIINLLALSYMDKYVEISKNLKDLKPEKRFNVLLKMPKEKNKESISFIFGDRSTYQDENSANQSIIKQKQFLTRMEKRLAFSKYSIEKAYLLHATAQSHLNNSRFDECFTVARKSITEAKRCNSLIWHLLGLLMICKSHAALHKIEKINDTLLDAIEIATRLDNEQIIQYTNLLKFINDECTLEKKLQEEFRKTKSRQSMVSSGHKNSSIASSY